MQRNYSGKASQLTTSAHSSGAHSCCKMAAHLKPFSIDIRRPSVASIEDDRSSQQDPRPQHENACKQSGQTDRNTYVHTYMELHSLVYTLSRQCLYTMCHSLWLTHTYTECYCLQHTTHNTRTILAIHMYLYTFTFIRTSPTSHSISIWQINMYSS